jgi:L-seryl-tRNA(Ser) seleniumtransferase
MLVLNSLARGKEVIVSRGQLVEIGGSFRIPDVMDKSGAIIHEVGTTNKTHLEDFEKAINDRTGMILVVHPSNFKVVGFSSDVDHQKLIALGREKSVPVVEDMGSGNFMDLKPLGITDEPTVGDHLSLGFDLVTFSGDKLLGGPQAGFIIGRNDLIKDIRKNHLLRPLRLCKTMYAAVAAVLLEYLKGTAMETIPVLKMIHTPYQALDERSRKFADRLNTLRAFDVTVEKDSFKIGGGAAPVEEIPTPVLVANPRDRTVDACLKHLREHRPPVIARAKEDRLIIDLRTVFPDQEADVFSAFQSMSEL